MLVLAPTRELAIQIFDVLSVLARRMGLKAVVVYGGASRVRQAEQLDTAHIIVATPGRLLDFLNSGYLDISKVSYLIIDEADQMLDMGFEPDMITINGFLSGSENRLTAMFSATWPKEVQELADLFLTNPILLSVGKANGDPQANKSITQNFQIFREPKAKLERLLELLNQMGPDKRVLVFTQTKIETNVLSYSLQRSGISSRYISSNLSQMSRERVLSDFKAGNISVLVATDVASRGLDIPDVEAVVNYSFPQTIEAYVHRIGRTGRAGKRGNSYTFLTPFEFVPIKQLISVIQKSNQVVPPELYSFKSMKHPSRHNNRSNSKTRQKFNNNNNNLNNRNNNNKLNSNRKPQMKESTGEDDFSVLKNLKKDPKKLAAIVNFINSLN
jgi:ATP-dependent RNA helicase DBP3